MAVYSVTYDLNHSNKNYDGLFEELKKSDAYIKYQKSAWLIKTNENVENLTKRIYSKLDKDDFLLVIEVKNNYQGWQPEEDWKFIREDIFS